MLRASACRVLFLIIVLPLLARAQAPVVTKPMIEPQLPQARLLVDGKAIKPTRFTPHWHPTYDAGTFHLELDGSHVAVRKPADSKPIWSVDSDDGKRLLWLAGTGEMAYFLAYEVDKEGRFQKYCEPPQVRRLDLGKKRWTERLPSVSEIPAKQKAGDVLAALADAGHLIVLATIVEANPPDHQVHVTEYVVSCFAQGKVQPLWTKSFEAAAPRSYSGGLLWAASVPFYPASDVQRLSWLGDRLLVCAEAKQPIHCLNPDTGTVLWSCERIWEYQRGFIGPSVWQHYIQRFGLGPFEELDEKKGAAEREQFNKQFDCSIIGGPIAVPLRQSRNTDTHSIFVAIAREPHLAFSGYLADCLVYEFSDKGQPISMVSLPQTVIGAQFQVTDNGLVWQGANDSMMMLRLSNAAAFLGMGPGGPDALTRIGWFQQPAKQEQAAWLVTARSGTLIAFDRTHAVRVLTGGFVVAQGDTVFQFPLSLVDLQSGAERSMTLRVPFRGDLKPPSINFNTPELPNGTTGYRSVVPYQLAITYLALRDSRLEIVLGMENWSASVEFDLRQLVADRTAPTPESGLEAWGKSLKDGKARDEALRNVASNGDTNRIKALLDAGADPRAKSEQGWTALMIAAFYGSAEAVDVLVKASCDLNSCDANCGGQSVLIWAARSGRESKRKVRCLLAAGVDRSPRSDGWNALLSAASSGGIDAVELLLAEGFDVNHCSKSGTSVLMAAASGSPPQMLSVLLRAGARVNDANQEGTTALMCAAKALMHPEAIQTLLDAGADPNRKDKQGRTALDICRHSNDVTTDRRVKLLEAATTRKAK